METPLTVIYDLHPERLRLDSTSISGDWRVTEEGLLQYGHGADSIALDCVAAVNADGVPGAPSLG